MDQKLLEILCCPKTNAKLIQEGDFLISTDAETRLKYRIEDNIPVMLIDEAITMDKEEWETVMKNHGKV